MSAEKILYELYQKDFKFYDHNGREFEIPVEGSLGLLADGYKGLIALRKKRKNSLFENKNEFIIGTNKKPEKEIRNGKK